MKYLLTFVLLILFSGTAQAQVFTQPEAEPEYLSRFEVSFGGFYTYSDDLAAVTDSTIFGTVSFVISDSLGGIVERRTFNLIEIQGRVPAQVRNALLDLKGYFAGKIREERSVK